ncbi:glycoside hydrolase family 78 protein [Deinococcus yavapaiensis]|uniref:alpha-L-rhamnosidase n=1 Tax=Deinococcus yavapaiensis KR-236 TaxID=694435 RepID=A0A318S5C3_9DEIO|nr:glycoside hydrolase family 78 protein [Deinococcus yavapaiensis]PYE51013.1 alpha-L-rhamnosidase [Deinococcus yavapaiensis KR-236]
MTITSPTTPDVTSSQTPRVRDVRAEHHREARGIGETKPRVSWRTETTAVNWRQRAYELEARDANGDLIGVTGRLKSDASLLQPWPFRPLTARERVAVRVRVWSDDERVSDWSDPLDIELGLLEPSDWTARVITPDRDEDFTTPQPCPLLRREFDAQPGVTHARLYITAHGVYEAHLNGQRVGDHVLAPGWTSYDTRLRYQTFDVTPLVRTGRNALGALIGDGWYRGRLGFGGGRRNLYGQHLALLAQLELTYADGRVERVVTDESWRASTGPILAADLYDGETYDARREAPGWTQAGFDDGAWHAVRVTSRDLATLVAPDGPPVRRIEERPPVRIFTSPSGKTLVDFGQNLVGWVRFTVRGEAGRTITLRHAEVLEHGELGTRPLRFADATDRYTLKGEGAETYEPRFTFHGFRYAEVEGWPGELTPSDLVAVVVHSDLERTGWFECSDSLVNKLHENVVWGMRGNFLDVPTDCPQRDERLGWTGDIAAFAPTATFLYDVTGFLTSWLADLTADQRDDGAVPAVIPHVLNETLPAAAWGDAATIVPWALYERTGDAHVLERQFDSMKAWVTYVHGRAGETLLWDRDFQFGDWLDPAAPPTNPAAGRTLPSVVATAYFARSAELVANAAHVLNRAEDERAYRALAADIRAAFAREYVTTSGRVLSDSGTAYALALQFALLPTPEQRARARRRLQEVVRENGYLISTGFVGTPLICDALCDAGNVEAAFRLLLQRECPSWLYPVTMGATTVWERWDSMLPDGSINPGEMTSFNHYALGAVADWLHRRVAGLAPATPGYRRLDVRPLIGGGFTFARARHVTPYGEARVAWRVHDGQVELDVVVPPNTTARVTLPATGNVLDVGSGHHTWTQAVPSNADRPVLSLDSDLDALLSVPGAYDAVRDLVARHSADHVDPFKRALRSSIVGANLRRAVWGVPHRDALLEKLTAALDALNTREDAST